MGKIIVRSKRKSLLNPAKATASEIAAALVGRGASPDKARLYADAFVEYREGQASVQKNGAVVADARTGKPMRNPYLSVRDKAREALERLGKHVDARWMWSAK